MIATLEMLGPSSSSSSSKCSEQIEDEAPLFGAGLGLDSIDALELVVMLEKNYGIVIKDIEEGRPAFRSVRTLADFIEARRST